MDGKKITLKHLAAVILWFLLQLKVVLYTFLKKELKHYETITMYYYRVADYKCNKWETLPQGIR